ncbi:lipoprotein [soil metagenome]
MQRPRLTRKHRNFAAAVTVGIFLGSLAFVVNRPADATDHATSPASADLSESADTATADSLEASTEGDGLAADSAAVTDGDDVSTEESVDETTTPAVPTSQARLRAGEDPAFAEQMGWPVDGPAALAGALLPSNRIVCYYGNPNSTRMGALGEFPKDDMLGRLKAQIDEWEAADPATPVKPCLHMVAVVAQGEPGTTGHYRSIMRDVDVQKVYDWAKEIDGAFIVDIQTGTDDLRNILPRFDWIMKNPDVHLGVDPEFMMKTGARPGTRIGTMDAADINYATDHLARLVREHDLPPKVLVIHRFTRNMVTNYRDIVLRPEVQIVMHMDGWGASWLKRDSYRDYVVREPVQYTGFKLFYHNDTKGGDPLMTPLDLLRLRPLPYYIQYQ